MSPQAGMPWAPTEHVPGEGLDDDPTPRGVAGAVLGAAVRGWLFRACGKGFPMPGAAPNSFRPMLPERFESHPVLGLQLPSAMAAAEHLGPLRMLDIGAGYGCWSSEMRRLAHEQGWPVHITGVELNHSRRDHGDKWCDEWVAMCWRSFAVATRSRFDLIIANPPFLELLREDGEFPRDESGNLDPARTMVPMLLELAPAVLMLHTQQAFLRGEMGRAVQRMCPPAASWQIPGPVSFRADGKSDARCYEATLWLRGHTGPCSRYLLPELSSQDRRWSVPPGSESIEWARANGYPLAPGVA